MGDERHSVALWLGLCLLENLHPWTVNFTSASQFSALRWDRIGWLEGAGVGYCPSMQVRL